jgi:hypothetical protein
LIVARQPTLYIVAVPGKVGAALILDAARQWGRFFVRSEDAVEWAKVNAAKGWSVVPLKVALPMNQGTEVEE